MKYCVILMISVKNMKSHIFFRVVLALELSDIMILSPGMMILILCSREMTMKNL